jgi:hypothetical protein
MKTYYGTSPIADLMNALVRYFGVDLAVVSLIIAFPRRTITFTYNFVYFIFNEGFLIQDPFFLFFSVLFFFTGIVRNMQFASEFASDGIVLQRQSARYLIANCLVLLTVVAIFIKNGHQISENGKIDQIAIGIELLFCWVIAGMSSGFVYRTFTSLNA